MFGKCDFLSWEMMQEVNIMRCEEWRSKLIKAMFDSIHDRVGNHVEWNELSLDIINGILIHRS